MSLTKIKASNITSTGVTSGSYTNANITVNSGGQITSASSGTGGGASTDVPKISNLQVTNSTWTVLDDTAVDVLGGYILLTGVNFVSGCLVYIGQTPATSVAFVSSTTVHVTLPAITAGTYPVYLVNPDGGVAIRVPGVTLSASPAWQTASGLADQYDATAISLQLLATDAASYSIASGSLPPGLTMNSSGLITGTVTGVAVDTTYTFSVVATDAQLQDSPRTFTLTITVSDPYFKLTTLLLTGNSGANIVTDASTNNFQITVVGDSRASNFSPYLTGWSNYFDGSGDYLSTTATSALAFGTGDFTIEWWAWVPSSESSNLMPIFDNDYNSAGGISFAIRKSDNFLSIGPQAGGQGLSYCIFTANFTLEAWNHFAVVAHNGVYKGFLNGTQLSLNTGSTTVVNVSRSSGTVEIGRLVGQTSFDFGGYLSNLRIVKGTALYTANFTPATTTLTAVANTSLLTCHANRFVDSSTNNFAITKAGDVSVVSFNPFNLTNTGTTGSIYYDNNGDYISIASNAAFDCGTSNWTIEGWVYVTSRSTNYPLIFGNNRGSFTTDALAITSSNADSATYNNRFCIAWGSNAWTTPSLGSSGLLVANVANYNNNWYYLAVVRNGVSVKIYRDGLEVASATVSAGATFNWGYNGVLSGGGNWDAAQSYFNGYISNLRLVKGTAVYTAAFTPPTAPLTAVANTSLLTLQNRQPHNNHSFQDSSTNNFLITRYGNATQGTFSPFSQSGWSVLFTGLTDIALNVTTGTGVAFGTGDFCQEFFVYPNSFPTNWRIISYASSSVANILQSGAGGGLGIETGGGIVNTGHTLTIGVWSHIVFTRQSGIIRVFVDGILRYNVSNTTNYSTSQNVYIGGFPGFTQSWDGYISNARIIKGSVPAAYQTSSTTNGATIFTSPSSPLSSVTGTELLLCQSNRFIDTNTQTTAKTIAIQGSPKIQAFSPYAPTAVYSAATHGGSAYFDGTGDYLVTATNALLSSSLLASDFTIEMWIYLLQAPSGDAAPIWTNSTSHSDQFTSSYIYNNFNIGTGKVGLNEFTSAAGVIKLNEWTHFACVRNGATVFIYVNGIQVASGAAATYLNTSTAKPMTFGRNYQSSPTALNGYLSGIRVVSSAIYTSNFTPPTAPVTNITNTSLLLNFTNDAIEDATGRNVIETGGDARTTRAVSKWAGQTSMYFDGSDFINAPAPKVLAFGTGNFTIEFWFYKVSNSSGDSIGDFIVRIGDDAYTKNVLTISTNTSHQITALIEYLGSSWTTTIVSSGTFAPNTWHHVALVRNGTGSNQTVLYVNGQSNGTGTASMNFTDTTHGTLIRFGASQSDRYYIGYLQDVRITRGYARYTSNFTPPTTSLRLK